MKRNSFRGLIPLTLSILVLGYSTNLEQVWADQKKVTLISREVAFKFWSVRRHRSHHGVRDRLGLPFSSSAA